MCSAHSGKERKIKSSEIRRQIIFKFSPIYRFLHFWSCYKHANKIKERNKWSRRKLHTCTQVSKILKLADLIFFEYSKNIKFEKNIIIYYYLYIYWCKHTSTLFFNRMYTLICNLGKSVRHFIYYMSRTLGRWRSTLFI